MYYYKQIDNEGNVIAVLTCSMHLESSDTQIELTEEEYNQLLAEMQEEQEAEPEIIPLEQTSL